MKNKLLTTALMAILCPGINAQTTFQKTYGGTGYDAAYDIQYTLDSGYIIAGETNSFGDASGDIYLIKVNNAGDTIWTRTFGLSGIYDYAISATPTADSGYIICGASANKLLVIKINPSGDTLWTKSYGNTGNSDGFTIQQTSDGGYIISGFTYTATMDTYLVKIDALGNITWTKTYGGSSTAIGQLKGDMIQQTADGGYILISQPGGTVLGNWDYSIVKTNSLGDTLWTKTYGGTNMDIAYAIKATPDGGYVVAGYTKSFGAGLWDAYVIKTNASGVLSWSKTYGGSNNDAATDIQPTTDGGYIFSGWTDSYGTGIYEAYAVKINSTGDTLWTRTYGGISTQHSADAYSVKETADGGYIFAGDIDDGTGNPDIYLIKTDANGNSGCNQSSTNTIATAAPTITSNTGIQLGTSTIISNIAIAKGKGATVTSLCSTVGMEENNVAPDFINIYPNPFSSVTTLQTDIFLNNATLTAYNSFGQQVKQIRNISGQTITLYRDNLPSGLYFIRLTQDNKTFSTNKLIVTDN